MELENEICPRCKDMHYPMSCSVSVEGQPPRYFCSNCAIDLMKDLEVAEGEWHEPYTSAVSVEGHEIKMYKADQKEWLQNIVNKFEHELTLSDGE